MDRTGPLPPALALGPDPRGREMSPRSTVKHPYASLCKMQRIKVINEISELVPVLRAVDTPLKLELLRKLSEGWLTEEDIEKSFGKEGLRVLAFFDKLRLVDTRWVAREGRKQPVRSYHTYYSTISISTAAPLSEVSEVLAIASMPDRDYVRQEKRIYDAIGDGGRFFSDVAEELQMSPTRLKALIKRSDRLEYRGHRIERLDGTRE